MRWRDTPISALGQLLITAAIAVLLAFSLLLWAIRLGAFDRLLNDPAGIFAGRVAALVDVLAGPGTDSRAGAPSSEAVTGSREDDASRQKAGAGERSKGNGNCSSPQILAVRILPGTIVFDPPEQHGDGTAQLHLKEAQNGISFALSTQKSVQLPATAGNDSSRLVVSLPNGELLSVPVPAEALASPFGPFLWLFSSLVMTLLAVVIWVVTQIQNPLRRITSAFASFDARRDWVSVPETGPLEIRQLTAELNRMAARTASLMRERAAIIGAINHDLRLPVTRLRLLTEQIEDADLRQRSLANLKSMEVMLHASLDYLKHGRPVAKFHPVDLVSILRTVSDEFADMGHDVAYDGPDHLKLHCDPDLIERALSNLLDNATRYALTVRLKAGPTLDGQMTIEVTDDGPGLSDSDKQGLLTPFNTAKAAENCGDLPPSYGLGLAIVKMIAEVHDGRLELSDAKPRGLTATITLPCDR